MKKIIKLTEQDLHRIVKQSVSQVLDEAYGTPSDYNRTQLQTAADARNMFANYGGGDFKDRDLHALTTIAQAADALHYNSHFLPPNYEKVVEKMSRKLLQITNYLQNKIQMKTGLQPTTGDNYIYNMGK